LELDTIEQTIEIKEEEEYRGIFYIQKDETAIKAGFEYIWLWIAIIKPKGREILLSISISKVRKISLLYPNFSI
jgi:hypothetical protein